MESEVESGSYSVCFHRNKFSGANETRDVQDVRGNFFPESTPPIKVLHGAITNRGVYHFVLLHSANN